MLYSALKSHYLLKKQEAKELLSNLGIRTVADMQSISRSKKGFGYFLCVIYNFSKYAWVVPFLKKLTIANAFQSILKDSN